MEKIKIAVVATDKAVRSCLATAAGESLEVVESVAPSSNTLVQLAGAGADAVVLYSDGSAAYDALAERIYIGRLALGVIMVVPQTSAQLLQRAMESGVARTLQYAGEETQLAAAVSNLVLREKNRASGTKRTGAVASKVVSVFGTKGGTGKTLLAVNLAVALASTGRSVALMDLDLQFGDVGIFLDIAKSDSIADVIEESAFDYPSLKSYLYVHPCGVAVLCAPASPEYAEVVMPEHVSKIIAALKSNYDYVILDMPPMFNDNSIAGLEASDTIYFIVNPDISTLRNTKVSLSVLDSLNLAKKVSLLLNKNGDSTIKPKDVEQILERPLALILPSDARTAIRSVNRGVPLVIGDKKTAIAAAIVAFAHPPQKKKR